MVEMVDDEEAENNILVKVHQRGCRWHNLAYYKFICVVVVGGELDQRG